MSEQNTVWTDGRGRQWPMTITVNTIRRVRELAGVNLLSVFEGSLLNQLAEDPELLVNTLYAVCKPLADERNVTDEQFGELLVGDAITEAATALVGGLIDFFPKSRGQILRRLWTATSKAQAEMIGLMAVKLDGPAIDQTIRAVMDKASDQIDSELRKLIEEFGNSPA
jgi:hypothetical protein